MNGFTWRCLLLSFVALILTGSALHAGDPGRLDLNNVGFDQNLDEQVPLNLEAYDEEGSVVSLHRYFTGKPVILVLAYYRCPMLCTEVLNALRDALVDPTFKLQIGKDFQIVTVSFDPRERPDLAAAKKQSYVDSIENYSQTNAAAAWHFLTARRESIETLTRTVGFRYQYDADRDQYAHASGIVVLTPQGKISRYFLGLQYQPRYLKFALQEAAGNKIGSPSDQLVLLCYMYDPATGKYTLAVLRLIQAGGLVTVVVLATWLFLAWKRDRKRMAAVMALKGPDINVQGKR